MSMRDEMARVREVRAIHEDWLLEKRNVVACGVGFKTVGDRVLPEPSLAVSVSDKLPVAQLARQDLVPARLDGVITDVVETGIIRAIQDRRGRWRPTVPPGVSIGHIDITAGTFGCLVKRGNQLFILSNNHVMANSNVAQAGEPILQPGPADGGTMEDRIAELADYVLLDFGDEPQGCGATLGQLQRLIRPTGGIKQGLAGQNEMDAALARPVSDDMVEAAILKVGVPVGVAEATLGTPVLKSGRTTGFTTGVITQIDVTVQVAYGTRVARFVNQLMAGAMSQGGDSGSAVLDEERHVVGLLFAGSDVTTLINPIQPILTALDIQIVTV